MMTKDCSLDRDHLNPGFLRFWHDEEMHKTNLHDLPEALIRWIANFSIRFP
jgi:hypothetical protein